MVISWLYNKTPQGDAMENREQVHRLRKRLLTLTTLARSDGQQGRVYTLPLLCFVFFLFHFILFTSGARWQWPCRGSLSGGPDPVKPESINHSTQAAQGWTQRAADEGLVKVKHGHQSTLANLHPPHPPPVCSCKASCQLTRDPHKWYLKTLRPLKGGRQGEKRKGSVCVGWGGDWRASVRAPAPSLDHRWLIVRPVPLIAAILKKTPGTPSDPLKEWRLSCRLPDISPAFSSAKIRNICPLFLPHSARLLPKKSCISINFTLPSGDNVSLQGCGSRTKDGWRRGRGRKSTLVTVWDKVPCFR